MSPAYIEIFHSKPSWEHAYVQRLASTSPPSWAPILTSDELVDASHIREKFRVARIDLASHGGTLRFTVTNGGARDWDGPPGNEGEGWFEIGDRGAYVVENGLRRVGDVGDEAVRVLDRPGDCWIEVAFAADLWERCFFAYKGEGEWVPPPGIEMRLSEEGERKFVAAVKERWCTFAFSNGKEGDEQVWDSNHGDNFKIGAPGKYLVVDGKVKYIGRADNDVKGIESVPASTNTAAPIATSSKVPKV